MQVGKTHQQQGFAIDLHRARGLQSLEDLPEASFGPNRLSSLLGLICYSTGIR